MEGYDDLLDEEILESEEDADTLEYFSEYNFDDAVEREEKGVRWDVIYRTVIDNYTDAYDIENIEKYY